MRFLNFLQYHNAVPIAISFVLLGAGGAFAATDPGAIYSSQQQVVSIDNTYIVNKDLSTYSPRVQITGVTEDSDNYYVAYNLSTIDLKNGVWQDVVKSNVMNVSKADLGPYRDLGIYVTGQLAQITERELDYLKQVQGIEQKNVTNKVVATQYGGLVGKFLDTSTEEIPGYVPVVQPPPPPPDTNQTAAAAAGTTAAGTGTSSGDNSSTSSGNPSLRMQILGNNPAQIPLRAAYIDLGAVVSDDANDNMGIDTFLNGTAVSQIQIDTSTTSVSTVTYKATDKNGNTVSADRKVYVYDPAVGPPVPQSQVQNSENTPPPPVTPPVTPVITPPPTTVTQSTDTSSSTPSPAATSTDATSSPPAPDTSATTTPPSDTATSSIQSDTTSDSTTTTADASTTTP